MSYQDQLDELLSRTYHRGTTVTNCVVHMGMAITARPDDCRLCNADVRNTLSQAIAINEWLNEWKDDATAMLGPRLVNV